MRSSNPGRSAQWRYSATATLLAEYCCDKSGRLAGSPEQWAFRVVSYSFFFGLRLPDVDPAFARILRDGIGPARLPAELAIKGLTELARTLHGSPQDLWMHGVDTLCRLAALTSPETFGPHASERLVKERMGYVGLTPGLLLALEEPPLGRSFAAAAVVENNGCPPKVYTERVTFIKNFIDGLT